MINIRPRPPPNGETFSVQLRREFTLSNDEKLSISLNHRLDYGNNDSLHVVPDHFINDYEFFAFSDIQIAMSFMGNAVDATGVAVIIWTKDPVINPISEPFAQHVRYQNLQYYRTGTSRVFTVPLGTQGWRCSAASSDGFYDRFSSFGWLNIWTDHQGTDFSSTTKRFYECSITGVAYGKIPTIKLSYYWNTVPILIRPEAIFNLATAKLIISDNRVVTLRIDIVDEAAGDEAKNALLVFHSRVAFIINVYKEEASDEYETFLISVTTTKTGPGKTLDLPTSIGSVTDWDSPVIKDPPTVEFEGYDDLWGTFDKFKSIESERSKPLSAANAFPVRSGAHVKHTSSIARMMKKMRFQSAQE